MLLAASNCIEGICPPPVPEAAPQGATLFGGENDEDWALLSYFHYLAYYLGILL